MATKKYASLSTLQTFLENLKNLFATKTEMDKKADVQIITQDDTTTTTEDVTTLKIHKLSQEQYDNLVANGDIDESALYLTPDEQIDLTPYATIEQLDTKAEVEHTHDDRYYTETEVDEMLVTHTHSYDDLEDKPCYEITDYSSIFIDSTFTLPTEYTHWGDSVYGASASLSDISPLTIGNIYKVIWDGQEYMLECKYFGDTAEGNQIAAVGAPYGDYSQYPFGIDSYMYISGVCEFDIHTNSTDATHSVDILEYNPRVITLDEKYIPDSIARTTDVDIALSGKSDISHTHNDIYYTKTEIDNITLITVEDIDAICGSTV